MQLGGLDHNGWRRNRGYRPGTEPSPERNYEPGVGARVVRCRFCIWTVPMAGLDGPLPYWEYLKAHARRKHPEGRAVSKWATLDTFIGRYKFDQDIGPRWQRARVPKRPQWALMKKEDW